MTTAASLLRDLIARGVALVAAGDKLRFHPRAAVSADDLAAMREHKAELLAMVANGDFPDGYSGPGTKTPRNAGNAGVSVPTVPQDWPGDDDHGDKYAFEERAAIHEYDGGLPRPEAERLARLAMVAGDCSPSGPTCPACGSARIAPGRRRLWCIDCETDIGPVIASQDLPDAAPADDPQDLTEGNAAGWLERIGDNGRRIWQRPEIAALEVIDWPDPCPVCGGIVWWQDLVDGWHCEACSPRTAGPRLRELAQRLRLRYGLPADDDHGQDLTEQRHGRLWPPPVPDGIVADSPKPCGDCGRLVGKGQPGTPRLCFGCWQKRTTNSPTVATADNRGAESEHRPMKVLQ